MRKLIIYFVPLFFIISGCQVKTGTDEIGSVISLTGAAGIYGKDAQKGIELALSELNSKYDNLNLTISFEDDNTQPQKAVSALNKIFLNPNIEVVIAPVGSSSFLSMCPIAESKKKVLFATGSSSPKITNAGDYIFRNWVSDDFEGKAMANYLIKRRLKKAVIFYVNNDYGQGLADVFENEFKKNGGEILLKDNFTQDNPEFRTQLLKIKESNADAIYLVGYSKELSKILNQSKSIGLNIPFFSSVTFENQDVIDLAGSNANGVVYTTTEIQRSKNDTLFNNFVKRFKKTFNTDPGVFALHAYDAMNIIGLAINKVGYDAEKIKDYLYTVKDYPGVSGLTTFDKNGDVIKPVSFKTVSNGKFVFLNTN